MQSKTLSLLLGVVAVSVAGALAGCADSQDPPKEDSATGSTESPADTGAQGDLALLVGPAGEVRIGDTLEEFKAAFPVPAGAVELPGDGYSLLGLAEWGWELEDRQYVSVGYDGDEVHFIDWWRNDMNSAEVVGTIDDEQSANGTATFVTNAASGTGRIWSGEDASRLLVAWTDSPYGCTIIVARSAEFEALGFRSDYLENMVRLMDMLDAPPPGMYTSSVR